MNKTRDSMSWLMTGIIFVGIGFIAGYAVSELIFGESTAPPAAAVSAVETAIPAPTTQTPAPTDVPDYFGVYYLVSVVDNELILYEADGDIRKILRKSKINVNSFPLADIYELKNGIRTGTLEGALEIWEGFVE